MGSEQMNLFDDNNEAKKQRKDDFLKELQEMDCSPETNVETNKVSKTEEQDELQKLNEELEQDKKDGLLYEEEPFYILDDKLIVTRYQEQIHSNLKNLAKAIIDNKWKQNINPDNIEVSFNKNDKNDYVYNSVICTNQYGVRFRVILDDILQKLLKIPFDD